MLRIINIKQQELSDVVTREQYHEMLDLVLDIHEMGNCSVFSLYGLVPTISTSVAVQFGGRKEGKDFDYTETFSDFAVKVFEKSMEQLRLIKNAQEAATSQGAVQNGQ